MVSVSVGCALGVMCDYREILDKEKELSMGLYSGHHLVLFSLDRMDLVLLTYVPSTCDGYFDTMMKV